MFRALVLLFVFVAVIIATEGNSESTQSPFVPTAPQTFDDFCDKNFGQTPSGRACKQWLDSDLDNVCLLILRDLCLVEICNHLSWQLLDLSMKLHYKTRTEQNRPLTISAIRTLVRCPQVAPANSIGFKG
ncbi:hypothetical protein PRIPAC_73165 [Pristionchus pacificus]|uniref:Uncharacterized protein n=1 Tax=Pristionchus pacificus TaxID=54126 RepID=A0A2A6CSJ2_PRIPA|nr:hypothetical protein PRIPAC_73165 [Pristionchus pacificus]|eukprot:PDM81109.1 hypothetical protein PRIPAC_36112 [Pristionchus pacificus]